MPRCVKIVFYIDMSKTATRRTTLKDVFPLRYGKNPLIVPFEGTFNDFVKQYLHRQKVVTAARRRKMRNLLPGG